MARPKKNIKLILSIVFLSFSSFFFMSPGEASISLNITAVQSGSFTATNSNFTLTFPDYLSGTVSNTFFVTYTVSANNVTRVSSVITGSLSGLYTGINLQASFGAYTQTGGNATLTASPTGFVTIGTANTGFANKVGSGKILSGSFPVTYRAVATADLTPQTISKTLTITFFDT